jgi:hypothetical protein
MVQGAKVLYLEPRFCSSIFSSRAMLPAAIFWWHKKNLAAMGRDAMV